MKSGYLDSKLGVCQCRSVRVIVMRGGIENEWGPLQIRVSDVMSALREKASVMCGMWMVRSRPDGRGEK
jgi:hypothetical protein